MKFETTRTYKNLITTFAGECQDGAKYQFMALKAKDAQLVDLQYTLKTLAKEEMGHAERVFNMLTSMGDCKNGTKCGLGSVEGVNITATYPFKNGTLEEMISFTEKTEKHQKDVVYKEFAKQAQQEGYDDVYNLFNMLGDVENCHSLLLGEISTMLKNKKLYSKPTKTIWKCSTCGYEHNNKTAPTVCPLCQKPQGYFYIKTSKYRYFMP